MQLVDLLVELGQLLEKGLTLEIGNFFHGWSPDELLVAFQTARYSRLSAQKHFVANGDVTGNSNLSAEHAPLAHLCRAGNADLGRHYRVGPNVDVVGYLYKVVELDAAMDDLFKDWQ